MEFSVLGDHLPLRELRKAGVLLQDIDVDVYWHVARHDYGLDQSFQLLSGKMIEPRYDEEKNISTFRVDDARLRGGRPFPPVIATTDLISNLLDEHSGKAYPVVIGSVKKLPLLDISGGSFDDFLVLLDRLNEWSSPPASLVSAIYDGDVAMTEPGPGAGEAQATDSDGNMYVHVTTTAGSTSRDVSADVSGHTPATPGETMRYLLSFFGDDSDIFDVQTLENIDNKLGAVLLGMAFNTRYRRGGVLDVLRDRICQLLPIAMVQRGSKYAFEPVMWEGPIKKHLRTGVNIIKKTSYPVETPRSQLHNSFVVRYGVSGYRGDHTGCVTSDRNSSYECELSARRYGETPPFEINAGDITNVAGARWLLNWLEQTFARMRVHVGYMCKLDVIDVHMLDHLLVTDDDEEWEETEFKVVDVRRGTGPWIGLDLVSVKDYCRVYDVNI